MHVGPTLVAHQQALEAVQPGERTLHHPAIAAQPGSMRRPSTGDDRLDAAATDLAPVAVVVVSRGRPAGAPVGDGGARRGRGPPGRDQAGESAHVTSLPFPPVSVKASGSPVWSTKRWCLEPARPRSTGLGPVEEPLFGLHVRRIGDGAVPVDLTGGAQLRKQQGVQLSPDVGLLPFLKVGASRSPHCRSRAPGAGSARRCRCARRRGSRRASGGRGGDGVHQDGDAQLRATAAGPASTAHPRRSTAQQPSGTPRVDSVCTSASPSLEEVPATVIRSARQAAGFVSPINRNEL